MRRVLSYALPWALAAVIAVVFAQWVVGPAGPIQTFRESIALDEPAPREDRRGSGEGRAEPRPEPLSERPGAGALSNARAALGPAAVLAGSLLASMLVLLAAIAAVIGVTRTSARSRRRMRRYRLVPGRGDEAPPDKVRRLLEAWLLQVSRRWWRRLVRGQPPVTLEVSTRPDSVGGGIHLVVAFPDEPGLGETLEGGLRACYPDASLEVEVEPPSAGGAIVRLRRRHGLGRALRVPARYDDRLMDAVLAAMQAAGEALTVQLTLTPAPRLLTPQRSGRLFAFGEIRVAARTWTAARRVAGVIEGESSAEDRLEPKEVHVRRALYARRIARGLGNPLPPGRRGVYSSAELAGLWQLPSASLKGVRLARGSVPRVPAPPGVLRPAASEALLHDEIGPVGIHPEDRQLGAMALGLPGSGTSSLLAASARADVLDENCCLVVLDTGSELSRAVLALLPYDFPRAVHVLDLRHPEVGYNPLRAEGERSAVASSVVEALAARPAPGPSRVASDRYLRLAVLAIMGWAERVRPAEGPNLHDVSRLLSQRGGDLRALVTAAIAGDPELEEARRCFAEELPGDLPPSLDRLRFPLDAARAALGRLTGTASLDSVLRHPVALDLDEIVRRREVLVVAGSLDDFADGAGAALMRLLLHGIHRAAAGQRRLPERQRARVALKVDGAHHLASRAYCELLAMGGAGGVECMSAWESLAQIHDPTLRRRMVDLHRHKLVFAVGAHDADEMAAAMQPGRADEDRDEGEPHVRSRVPADALSHLPSHFAAVSLVGRGVRLESFVAQTAPLPSGEALVDHHLTVQRRRGGYYAGVPPVPERRENWLEIG